MIQFYSSEIDRYPTLGPAEAHHCIKVLRRKCGDVIHVTDGKGNRYECRIVVADTRHLELKILHKALIPKGWNYDITLAVAPTKNADRMAWLVEKSIEIGVDRIIFLDCKNGERKNINIERLKRNAISAMNQSLKTKLPEIQNIDSLDSILNYNAEKFFGYCNGEIERTEFVKEYQGGDIIIAIGPEGDFDIDEVKKLINNGYKAVTFGEERLRTETAALYGVTATHIINEIDKNR